jgi:SAM-dependent methyltransferase
MNVESWSDLIRCPFDVAVLRHETTSPGKRAFVCTSCGNAFPVEDGIVRFLRDEKLTTDQKNEITARDDAANEYEQRFSRVRNAIESDPALAAMRPIKSDVVAELGCGTGRITRLYAGNVKRTVAIDFSLESLLTFRRTLPASLADSVLLVQGDVSTPPLADRMFSKVVSFQVFQHLPTQPMRDATFAAAKRILDDRGTLTCTVYNWSRLKRRLAARGLGDNTRKEGLHGGKIYYFNFEPHDIAGMLDKAGFDVDLLRGMDMQVRGIDLVGRLAIPINDLLARTPLGVHLGHLLLVHARARRARAGRD